jgi:glycine cleavage system H protein
MEIPEQVYQGCWVPPELSYDIERDVWARFEEDGMVTLGMTDVAQTKAGKLVSVLFKAPGKVLRSGQSAATIESAKWVGPFPTPLSGEIVAVNEAPLAQPAALNADPYSNWIVKLAPSNWDEEAKDLVTGEQGVEVYRALLQAEGIDCGT